MTREEALENGALRCSTCKYRNRGLNVDPCDSCCVHGSARPKWEDPGSEGIE